MHRRRVIPYFIWVLDYSWTVSDVVFPQTEPIGYGADYGLAASAHMVVGMGIAPIAFCL